MRAVNLLPGQTTSSAKLGVDRALVLAIGVTVLVTILVAGGYFLERSHASSEAQRAAAIEAALQKAQAQQQTSTTPTARLQIPVVLSQEQPWHVALDAALSTRVPWDTFLQQLEYVVPDRIRITSITLGGAGGGTADGTISIGGTAFSQADVAIFLSTLQRVPHVSGVTLVNTTANAQSTIQNFQITAQMALPAALTAPPVTATTTTTGG